MLSLGCLLLTLPILGSGITPDVAAGAEATVEGGQMAVARNAPAELGFSTAITLKSGLRLANERTVFQLLYHPRYYLQLPNEQDTSRPLLLHQLYGSYETAITRRTALELFADARVGEISYRLAGQVLDAGTESTEDPVLPLFLTRGRLQLSHQAARRYGLHLGLQGGYDSTLSEVLGRESSDRDAFPTSSTAALEVGNAYVVSPSDTLSAAILANYVAREAALLDERSRLIGAGARLNWDKKLSERATFSASLGGSAVEYIDEDESAFLPEGSVNHVTTWRMAAQTWTSRSGAGVRSLYDRVRANYRVQAYVRWQLGAQIGRSWSLGPRIFGATSLSSPSSDVDTYETFANLDLPAAYEVTQNSQVNFGARAQLRAPHLSTREGPTTQLEFVGFFGYQVSFGTDADHGAWVR